MITSTIVLLLHIAHLLYADDNLPPCHQIPKLLCCTERVLDKCLSGCVTYVSNKCPQKLRKYDTITTSPSQLPQEDDDTAILNIINEMEKRNENQKSGAKSKSRIHAANLLKEAPDGSTEGFFEQKSSDREQIVPLKSPSPEQRVHAATSVDYSRLNQQYPITEVTDNDLTSDCGTQSSRPPYSPCLSRKLVDEQFLACCQQHVPSRCHSLCTFEHREYVAAQTLIQAVQQDQCSLKYLSKILYCANRNRDNRKCCEFLGLASSELGVGERCLRMCNVGQSGDRIGTIEKNDLVCLSNWNVIMYCARAGLRTIN
uniref:DB domain-containing protein n=1 Tax=Syphacia muris TaxID=451379 RepID=A0A158R502_9BILA